MVFDVIFMFQHYYLYYENNAKPEFSNSSLLLQEIDIKASVKGKTVKPNVRGILPD